jgi:50S ribosomal subunit-associated GTPase HflX
MVCDRSSPVWEKQRATVLKELSALGCGHIPIIELWNKIDLLPNAEEIQFEAASVPIDVDVFDQLPSDSDDYNDMETAVIDDPQLLLTNTGPEGITTTAEAIDDVSSAESIDEEENTFVTRSLDDIGNDSSLISTSADHSKSSSTSTNEKLDSLKSSLPRYYRTVAASAKSGDGIDDFLDNLRDALDLYLISAILQIPYHEDKGYTDWIYQHGIVEHIEYEETGSLIYCRLPEYFMYKLAKYQIADPNLAKQNE